MTPERVAVLAVTKMLSGMCTGGVSLATGKWVRPVKQFGTLLLGDLTYQDRTVMQPFDIVEFSLIKPQPRPPHSEDWTCDFVRARPRRTGAIEDRLAFMQRYSEPDSPVQVLRAQRSLALFEPSNVEAVFMMDDYSGKYEARVRTPETGERPLPVTDIKWRALGRSLLAGAGGTLNLSASELRDRLGAERVFVALGLGRLYEGKHWPLVIGIHTWPDYQARIDYRNL